MTLLWTILLTSTLPYLLEDLGKAYFAALPPLLAALQYAFAVLLLHLVDFTQHIMRLSASSVVTPPMVAILPLACAALSIPCTLLLPPLVNLAQPVLYVTALYGPYVLLATLILLFVILLLLVHRCGFYSPERPRRTLTRAELRHRTWNVFVLGLPAKGVLLRVPFDATTDWVEHELKRRHFYLPDPATSGVGYYMLLSPGDGAFPNILLPHQNLARVGLCDNSTIHVRYTVYGGMQAEPSENDNTHQCPGCNATFDDLRVYNMHRGKVAKDSPCRRDLAQETDDARFVAERRRAENARIKAERADALEAKRAKARDAEQTGSGSKQTGSRTAPTTSPARSSSGTSAYDGDAMDVDLPEVEQPSKHDEEHTPEPPLLTRVARRQVKREDSDEESGEEEEEEDEGGWGQADEAKARLRGLKKEEEDEQLEEGLFKEEEDEEDELERERQICGDDDSDDDAPLPEPPPPPPPFSPPPQRFTSPPQQSSPPPQRSTSPPQQSSPPPPPPPPPRRPGPEPDPPPGDEDEDEEDRGPTPIPRAQREVEPFTSPTAGAPVPGAAARAPFEKYESKLPQREEGDNNPYHPFASKMDWDVASWAKTHGIGANALTDLLHIDTLADQLGLQYHNNQELNNILDEELPGRPEFKRRTYELGGEKLELYMRDSLAVVKDLFGRSDFGTALVFAPEKHYTIVDDDPRKRAYSDMHTGQWWWRQQKILERKKPGATIIPLIISSDKTQLTLFRNRSAYPVYLTIGNLPKELRRKTSLQGQLLIGYLPVTKLTGIKNEHVRRRAQSALFHMCMRDILKPLRDVAQNGIVLTAGDGVRRRCHPLLAAFVGDYPEQVLAAGVKYMQCPKGMLDTEFFEEEEPCAPRDAKAAADALNQMPDFDDPQQAIDYIEACQEAGIKPIQAFWQDYPYADIFLSIQPDILHQLYQGMVKHLISWLKVAYGKKALDARFKCLPDNHQLRLFNKGISVLSRVSGTEHQDICRVLLGVIADLPLRKRNAGSPARAVKAVRALLDFVYLAQYPEASETTLEDLEAALHDFHTNKEIFRDLGIRSDFNLPKLHSLAHYVEQIKMFGTPDNFNTSYSERLHIDYAKSAYRATNRKDEYPQMVNWLQRREQIRAHEAYIHWRLQDQPDLQDMVRARLPGELKLKKTIATYPSVKCLSFKKAERLYGAEAFERVLREWICQRMNPNYTDRQVRQQVQTTSHIPLPFATVPVFHRLKFWHKDALQREGDMLQEIPDSILARPAYKDTQRRKVQGQFSTALVDEYGRGDHIGVQNYRIGQIRLIFKIPEAAREVLFPDDDDFPEHLAFIEWFTEFRARPQPWHHLYSVKRDIDRNGESLVSILPTDRIRRSAALTPKFGPTPRVDPTWTSDNVLERCHEFYVNSFSDKHAYITMR